MSIWGRFWIAVLMSPGLSALCLWWYVLLLAVIGTGEVLLNANGFNEAVLELLLLSVSIIAWTIAFILLLLKK